MSVENIPLFKTSHWLTIKPKPFIMASKALHVAPSHFLWLASLSQLSEVMALSLVKSHSQPGPLHLLVPRTRLCSPSCEPAYAHHSTLCLNVSSSETCSDILSKISASHRPSLVVQWLRIHLAMQGTQVQSPVGELRTHMPRDN